MLLSVSGNDDLEVFGRHDHGAVARAIELRDEREQVALERALRRGLQRGEGLVHRAVVGPEHLEPVLGRAVAEYEMALRALDRARLRLEQLVDARSAAPQRRRVRARRGRDVPADGLEHLADEALR